MAFYHILSSHLISFHFSFLLLSFFLSLYVWYSFFSSTCAVFIILDHMISYDCDGMDSYCVIWIAMVAKCGTFMNFHHITYYVPDINKLQRFMFWSCFHQSSSLFGISTCSKTGIVLFQIFPNPIHNHIYLFLNGHHGPLNCEVDHDACNFSYLT